MGMTGNGIVTQSEESVTPNEVPPSIPLFDKDHGTRRQKKLLVHVVRLRLLACRNDLNRKRIVSLQLTAHS